MTLAILGLVFVGLMIVGLPISFAVGVASVIGTFLLPGVDNATIVQRMLTAIMPKEKVDSLMAELQGPAGRNIWDKLANVNEAVLASYLKN